MGWWVTQYSLPALWGKIRRRVVPNLRYLPKSRLRVCGACGRRTLFVALGPNDEFELCLRCRANLRYEMLAEHVRALFDDLSKVDVLELDFHSPLRPLLSGARTYTPSYFRPDVPPGSVRADGVVCQDITGLTFGDASLDLIVSSDVLEHVPNAGAAFRESARVLRPGGAHVFTVPPRAKTQPRTAFDGSDFKHLLPPEYHFDPLDARGVLTHWDFGPDLNEVFGDCGLVFRIVSGPRGPSHRIVWEARK